MACHGLNVMAPKSFEVWGCEAIKRVEPRDIGVCMYVCMHACMHVCMYVMYVMYVCMYVCNVM